MKPFKYIRANTKKEAIEVSHATSAYLGGGTNLIDLMKKNIYQPDSLVDVKEALPNKICISDNGLVIGAATKNTEIATHPLVLERAALLSQAILKGASPQIRNMATAAGNILQRTRCPYFYDTNLPCNKRKPGTGCGAKDGHHRTAAIIGYSPQCIAVHPSDFCVALTTLDAKVNFTLSNGQKETVNLSDFQKLPGNSPEKDHHLPENAIITSLFIPENNFNSYSSYLKLRDRDEYAFALISVAAALEMDGKRIKQARIASGGVAHKPWRWFSAEQFLKNKEALTHNFEKAAELAIAETSPLTDNQFKQPMLKAAIIHSLETALNN